MASNSRLSFGHPQIPKILRSKAIYEYDKEIKGLEKDMRLQMQRKKELAWKGKIEHLSRRKWITKMLEEGAKGPATGEGYARVMNQEPNAEIKDGSKKEKEITGQDCKKRKASESSNAVLGAQDETSGIDQ